MNELMRVFDYEGAQVRTVIQDGLPWFVAKDVCNILEITNSRDAVARLDEDEKGVVLTDTPGGSQQLQAVTESGLYVLVLSSRKPEAKAFKRWVTHEVIPSIRKHGLYATDELLGNPDLLISLAIELKNEREQRKRLETERLRLLPKADFHDAVSASSDNLTIQKAAKILGTGELRLFQFLRDQKVFMANNQPYQEYLDRGYFRVLLKSRRFDGEDHIYTQTVITAKGMPWLRKLLAEKAHLKVVGRDA
jgi:anti-repressor protein